MNANTVGTNSSLPSIPSNEGKEEKREEVEEIEIEKEVSKPHERKTSTTTALNPSNLNVDRIISHPGNNTITNHGLPDDFAIMVANFNEKNNNNNDTDGSQSQKIIDSHQFYKIEDRTDSEIDESDTKSEIDESDTESEINEDEFEDASQGSQKTVSIAKPIIASSLSSPVVPKKDYEAEKKAINGQLTQAKDLLSKEKLETNNVISPMEVHIKQAKEELGKISTSIDKATVDELNIKIAEAEDYLKVANLYKDIKDQVEIGREAVEEAKTKNSAIGSATPGVKDLAAIIGEFEKAKDANAIIHSKYLEAETIVITIKKADPSSSTKINAVFDLIKKDGNEGNKINDEAKQETTEAITKNITHFKDKAEAAQTVAVNAKVEATTGKTLAEIKTLAKKAADQVLEAKAAMDDAQQILTLAKTKKIGEAKAQTAFLETETAYKAALDAATDAANYHISKVEDEVKAKNTAKEPIKEILKFIEGEMGEYYDANQRVGDIQKNPGLVVEPFKNKEETEIWYKVQAEFAVKGGTLKPPFDVSVTLPKEIKFERTFETDSTLPERAILAVGVVIDLICDTTSKDEIKGQYTVNFNKDSKTASVEGVFSGTTKTTQSISLTPTFKNLKTGLQTRGDHSYSFPSKWHQYVHDLGYTKTDETDPENLLQYEQGNSLVDGMDVSINKLKKDLQTTFFKSTSIIDRLHWEKVEDEKKEYIKNLQIYQQLKNGEPLKTLTPAQLTIFRDYNDYLTKEKEIERVENWINGLNADTFTPDIFVQKEMKKLCSIPVNPGVLWYESQSKTVAAELEKKLVNLKSDFKTLNFDAIKADLTIKMKDEAVKKDDAVSSVFKNLNQDVNYVEKIKVDSETGLPKNSSQNLKDYSQLTQDIVNIKRNQLPIAEKEGKKYSDQLISTSTPITDVEIDTIAGKYKIDINQPPYSAGSREDKIKLCQNAIHTSLNDLKDKITSKVKDLNTLETKIKNEYEIFKKDFIEFEKDYNKVKKDYLLAKEVENKANTIIKDQSHPKYKNARDYLSHSSAKIKSLERKINEMEIYFLRIKANFGDDSKPVTVI